jgi:hypothetical protein
MKNRRSFILALALAFMTLAVISTAAAQGPPMPGPMGAPGGAPPASTGAAWLKGFEGGMPWQIGALFTGFWVLVAVEVVVLSKSSYRPDKPKKVVEEE